MIEIEKLVIVEACSAKMFAGTLRVRCKPNTAVEFTNGPELLAMVANFQEPPKPVITEDPMQYKGLQR